MNARFLARAALILTGLFPAWCWIHGQASVASLTAIANGRKQGNESPVTSTQATENHATPCLESVSRRAQMPIKDFSVQKSDAALIKESTAILASYS